MIRQTAPGQFWRIGADIPATLDSDRDLNFNGTIVPKGKHVLMARRVGVGKWTLVFSGGPAARRGRVVKRPEVPVTLQETKDSTELVTIQLTDNNGTGVLEIVWGKLHLSTSFRPA